MLTRIFKPTALATVLGLSATLSGVPALAAEEVRAIEEVIVTAERRAESLQSVAVAVTAFTGEDLDAQGIVDIKGITERTPGFTMGVFNPGQPQFYIRGIGSNEDGAGGDQSVIIFVDEVYIGRSAGSDLDLFDLERVEVLRGPQGTLFGKNVIGGAVSLITKKPSENNETVLQATVGNLKAMTLRGLASGEIAENVYGKISFSSRRREGYVKSMISQYPEYFPSVSSNLLGDFDQHNINSDSFRGALRFIPSDRMEVNLTANYSTMDRAGPSYKSIGPGGIPFSADAALLPNYVDNIHQNLLEDPGLSRNDIFGFTARIDYEISDSMSFSSLTSYRTVEADQQWFLSTPNLTALRLSSGIPQVPLYLVGSNDYSDDSDTFTHEFRLTGSTDRLDFVAGVYFMNEQTDRNETSPIGLSFSDGAGGIAFSIPVLDGGDLQENETDSYSFFGQVSFNLTDDLSVTLGGRKTWDEKNISRLGTPTATSPNRIFDFTTGKKWNAFTGKFGIEWQATDDLFVYATAAEGFKSGGYQGAAATYEAASTPFNPEEALLIELGIKAEFWDNRIRLNTAIFSTDYEDLQILQLLVENAAPPGTSGQLITQNAANADIEGVEVEFTIIPSDKITIQGSYTHLDTAFSDFFLPEGFGPPTDPTGVPTVSPDRTGNSLRNAPENAYNILVRYDTELSNGGGLALQADFRHKDKVYQDPDVLEFAAVPEYDVVDLRATYTFPNGNVDATLWSRNAADEDYYLHNWPLQGSGQATPAPPRTYGLTVTWRNE
ncbi:MAG: TonB-dependent receptor [Gammaproteobacteria bacterium]|jgi:iron complex outermembrane recepter protein|nr:TonB-dependent receptor [Gammaproteobacteria bacterium]MBT5601344.1 TonB-dependent receptor [Gammaproteobacteria bacterium]MBT6246775.1 TonB-dependent receptor [Gammaproteobacteria bacterium]